MLYGTTPDYDLKTLICAQRGYGLPATRIEEAFIAFPASHVTPRLTTAERYAEMQARHEADQRGQTLLACTHKLEEVGEPPHQRYALRFTFVDGQEQYFPPHTA